METVVSTSAAIFGYTLSMRFLKSLLVFLLLTFTFYLLPSRVFAQGEFTTDAAVTYNVQDSGNTLVTHDITLENNFSTLYATTYTLTLENIDVQNVKASELINNQPQDVPTDVSKSGDITSIKVNFNSAVVGKGAKRHFFISYQNATFAVRTGEVWEVSIPKLSDGSVFRSYQVILQIPDSFGLEAYVSPKQADYSEQNGIKVYTFTKDALLSTGITAGFGQFQVFSFNLSYHLENPLARGASTQIALPPDTAFQKVYFTKIDPIPSNVNVDEDGNWVATYNLSPRQRIDVTAVGSVQIFAGFRPFPKLSDKVLSDNLKDQEFWQVNDPQIKALASKYKTPRDIYNYVSTTLKYGFDRVQPNVQRFGAVKALENPTEAICMEYTDLFIAIARAAGIPAREINGFAYTENPQLQPLSLVADVLHAWPEYYDKDKGVWIPVDPTWGSTTGGVDYFDKLDLRHFAFVVHGASDTQPFPPGSYKLGPNPQKDVYVTFGKLPQNRTTTPVLSAEIKRNIPFLNLIYTIQVKNPGPGGLYSLYPTIYFDDKEVRRDFIQVLPPYSNYSFDVEVPFSILGKDTPQQVKVVVSDAQIQIFTNKSQVIINSLLGLFIIFILIMIWVLIKIKKITFKHTFATIKGVYGKITGKSPKAGGQS